MSKTSSEFVAGAQPAILVRYIQGIEKRKEKLNGERERTSMEAAGSGSVASRLLCLMRMPPPCGAF
jgi:hypothetical protein